MQPTMHPAQLAIYKAWRALGKAPCVSRTAALAYMAPMHYAPVVRNRLTTLRIRLAANLYATAGVRRGKRGRIATNPQRAQWLAAWRQARCNLPATV